MFSHASPHLLLLFFVWYTERNYITIIIKHNIYIIYHRGTNCFFLPGFTVVCLKCSCVSFFCVGANWSYFTKLDTFWLDVVAVIDTCAWVSSVITLYNILWSLMSFTADAISDVSCCIVLLVSSTDVKVNNNDMQIIISILTGCFLIFFWKRNTQCDTWVY